MLFMVLASFVCFPLTLNIVVVVVVVVHHRSRSRDKRHESAVIEMSLGDGANICEPNRTEPVHPLSNLSPRAAV